MTIDIANPNSEQVCSPVRDKECSDEVKEVTERVCSVVETEECKDVEETECKPAFREECFTVPSTTCKVTTRQLCETVERYDRSIHIPKDTHIPS